MTWTYLIYCKITTMSDPIITPTITPNGQPRVKLYWYHHGQSIRKTFRNASDAKEFVRSENRKIGSIERTLLQCTPEEQCDLITALGIAQEEGFTLTEAARAYITPKTASVSIEDAERAWFARCRDENLREATVYAYERALRSLRILIDKPPGEITRSDVEEYLRKWTGSTRNWYRRHLRAVFAWWLERGMIQGNPFESVKPAKIDWHPPCILNQIEATKLMATALEQDPETVPYFALGLFAGIRPRGLQRLNWSDVDLKQSVIQITGTTNKTRGGFSVTMQPNLKAWLRAAPKPEIITVNHRKRCESIRAAAEVTWGPDIMRHSFASHHLAAYRDSVETADQLGHEDDTSMLFKHYRARVTQSDGLAYFKINP